jgi:hypothetical protein
MLIHLKNILLCLLLSRNSVFDAPTSQATPRSWILPAHLRPTAVMRSVYNRISSLVSGKQQAVPEQASPSAHGYMPHVASKMSSHVQASQAPVQVTPTSVATVAPHGSRGVIIPASHAGAVAPHARAVPRVEAGIGALATSRGSHGVMIPDMDAAGVVTPKNPDAGAQPQATSAVEMASHGSHGVVIPVQDDGAIVPKDLDVGPKP